MSSTDRQFKLVALSGSPSPVSKTAKVCDYLLSQLNRSYYETRHYRISAIPAQALLSCNLSNAELVDAMRAVDEADGIIVATPVFKASFSGLIKMFLDVLPQFGMAGKAVLPVATGGSLAHVLAVDYALRPVLQSMGARHVVQAQFLPESHILCTENGITVAEETLAPLMVAMRHFVVSISHAPNIALLGHPRPEQTV